jgi:hypothetical protein
MAASGRWCLIAMGALLLVSLAMQSREGGKSSGDEAEKAA